MRRALVLLTATALAIELALIACSTPYASDDGPTTTTEAGPDSAGLDGSTTDADAEAGAAVPFCSSASSVFCDDFDDPGLAAWDDSSVGAGDTLDVSDASSVSPPNALRATVVPPPAGQACRYAVRQKTLDVPAPNGFRADLKVLPGGPNGKLPSQVVVGIAVAATDDAGRVCGYYLRVGPDTAELVTEPTGDGGAPTSFPLNRKLIGGAWHAVTIELSGPPGAGRMAHVVVDGVSASATSAVAPFCQSATRITAVQVGVQCIGDNVPGTVEAWFDDVRLTLP